jgi:hypothetical protein
MATTIQTNTPPGTDAPLDKPAVILLIRTKRFSGVSRREGNRPVKLNGVDFGRINENSFCLLRTTKKHNVLTLPENARNIPFKAKSGEKILILYHEGGLSEKHDVTHDALFEAMGDRLSWALFVELFLGLGTGIFFMARGAEKLPVLGFGSEVTVIIGIFLVVSFSVALIKNLSGKSTFGALGKFLKENGHLESPTAPIETGEKQQN